MRIAASQVRRTFALRSYLPAGHELKDKEIGSEPTPDAFIATMVAVFREVRRVLHPSGLVFVNLGDSYSTDGKWGGETGGKQSYLDLENRTRCGREKRRSDLGNGQLLNMPHRVAEALRADGWLWRQTIVWAKPSPMPESVNGWRWVRCRVKVANGLWKSGGMESGTVSTGRNITDMNRLGMLAQWSDCPGCEKCAPNGGYILRRGKGRCTTAHEFIFVMAKGPGYFWDSAAFVEKASENTHSKGTNRHHKNGLVGRERQNGSFQDAIGEKVASRNPRSVWTISPEPSSEKHFASYPSELVRRCIQAGTSNGGCCPVCLAPWAPVVDSTTIRRERPSDKTDRHAQGNGVNSCGNTVAGVENRILGYRPTCNCEVRGKTPAIEAARIADGVALKPWSIPCTVLEPFTGTGTTLQVARAMGRAAVGIELSPDYCEIAARKIPTEPRCMRKKASKKPKRSCRKAERLLF